MSGAGSSEERQCSGGHAMTGLMKSAIANDLASIKHALDSSTIHCQLDSIDAKGCTALMLAAEKGHMQIVRALLAAGPDLDAVDADGLDAAGLAETRAGHAELARLIRAEQANRRELWAKITQDQQPAVGPGASASSTSKAPAHDATHMDMMAKLLAEAGLPGGPKECPF
jgi:hypothetical protein